MNRWRERIVLLLTASGLFLYALPSPSLTYGAIVLLHVALGALFVFLLLSLLARLERTEMLDARFAWALLACGAILGLALIYLGTPHRLKGWFYAHIFRGNIRRVVRLLSELPYQLLKAAVSEPMQSLNLALQFWTKRRFRTELRVNLLSDAGKIRVVGPFPNGLDLLVGSKHDEK